MAAFAPDSLLAHRATIPDPRSPHGRRFALPALLASACAAILCGQISYAAIAQWTRNQPPAFLHALGFFRTPPTDGAYRSLFALLDLGAFEAALSAWISPLAPRDRAHLRPTPLDGKTLRGSDDRLRGAVHLLSLLDGPTGGVLKQVAVDRKTNEHKAAFALLAGVLLRGRIVTADAMFCHRDLARQIRTRGGHYLLEVKDNQQELKRDIASAFEPAFSPLRAAAARGGGRRGDDHGQPRRAGRDADAADDDAAERLPGLAGRGAGVPAGARGAAERAGDAGRGVCDHQRGPGAGGRGGAAGLVAGPLGDREPVALGAGRDDG